MPYLPPSVINDTVFPTASNPYKDIIVASRTLIEVWERYYPIVVYRMIDLDVRKAVDEISGNPPHTIVDDLTGEDIPYSMAVGGGYHQPHAHDPVGDALDATVTTKFKDSINVNMQISIVSTDKTLTEFGRKQGRDVQIVVPTPLLDKVGIEISIKDEFTWNGHVYEIVNWSEDYLWKNTNYFMHINAYAMRKEIGS